MSGPGRSGWVFLINVPVVVVGLFVGVGLIPESRAAERPGLDRAGMAGSTAALVAVTYGLIEAGQDGWGDPAALALMAVGLVLLGGFVARERGLGRTAGAKLTVTLGFGFLGAGSLVGAATGTASGATFVAIWMVVLCAGAGMVL